MATIPIGAKVPRMRVLWALSPANQMYSGIGRAIFEVVRRTTDRIAYEFAMSDMFAKNLDIVRAFCEAHGLPLHVGRGRAEPGSLDTYNDDLAETIRRGRYDVVETVCWANAATNQCVLDGIGDMTLAYTPHDQPIWTVPMSETEARHIESVHDRMLLRSDVVFCDSPHERRDLTRRTRGRDTCIHLNLGCDFRGFRPGPVDRPPRLLFVGDLAEPRKRFDRVIAVFEHIHRKQPEYRLVVVGNRSNEVGERIPPELRGAVELRGYVSEAELRRAYAESRGLFLLSDFEAFGVPIVEALACGTPVFLTRLEQTHSLFGSYRGAHFCPSDDFWRTLEIVETALSDSRKSIAGALADRTRLESEFDWDLLAERKRRALAAAWFARNAYSWSAVSA